jgi:hypothetical protein
MSLTPIGNPAWETIRGVRFAMRCGSTLVPVLITHAALDGIELAESGVGGHLACFNKHRSTCERIANAKHQRHQLGETGMVTVEVGDLKLILA